MSWGHDYRELSGQGESRGDNECSAGGGEGADPLKHRCLPFRVLSFHRLHLSQDLESRIAFEDFCDTFLTDVYDKLSQSQQADTPIRDVIEDLFLALSEHRQQCVSEDWKLLGR